MTAEILHLPENEDEDFEVWHPVAIARMVIELKLLMEEQSRIGGKVCCWITPFSTRLGT